MIESILKYIHSIDYIQAIFGNISSAILQSIFILFFLSIYFNFRDRGIKWLVSFEFMRIQEKCLALFANIAFGEDLKKRFCILAKCMDDGEIEAISSHRFYGKYADNLVLMTKKANADEILANLKIKEPAEIAQYVKTLDECLSDLEKMSLLLNALPKYQKLFFEYRVLYFPLRDALIEIEENPKDMLRCLLIFNNEQTIPSLILEISKQIEKVSKPFKKIIDKKIKNDQILNTLFILLYAIPEMTKKIYKNVRLKIISKKRGIPN